MCTGGLAIDAQLRAHARQVEPRHLNDIDFVVEDFASISRSLAGSFLQHHVHQRAINGRTLLQLIDEPRAIRIDLFRALGSTLSRAATLDAETGPLDLVSVEDLVARTTALVCGTLRRGKSVDGKHATAFTRLLGLGRPEQLAAAWNDHGQEVPGLAGCARSERASKEATFCNARRDTGQCYSGRSTTNRPHGIVSPTRATCPSSNDPRGQS